MHTTRRAVNPHKAQARVLMARLLDMGIDLRESGNACLFYLAKSAPEMIEPLMDTIQKAKQKYNDDEFKVWENRLKDRWHHPEMYKDYIVLIPHALKQGHAPPVNRVRKYYILQAGVQVEHWISTLNKFDYQSPSREGLSPLDIINAFKIVTDLWADLYDFRLASRFRLEEHIETVIFTAKNIRAVEAIVPELRTRKDMSLEVVKDLVSHASAIASGAL